jgi:DNA-binding MarR family transcriptional regulator
MTSEQRSEGALGAKAIAAAEDRPPSSPDRPLPRRADPASEAWMLMHRLFLSQKPRFLAIGQEFDLAPQQVMAVRVLEEPLPMGELAKLLACDNSNVTGIVDRLEERGLVERRPAQHDRRIKLLFLTEEGDRLRREITRRISEPPEQVARLSVQDQRRLRDILQKALGDGA